MDAGMEPSIDSSLAPPEPIISDYVEMCLLVLLFLLGAPLNLAAYTQLSERAVHSRLDILKRHLNYSDMLVVFIYVPSRALWLLTYDWRGGDALCKLVKFMHTFAFQSSSNVIVCIAVDRLLSVMFPSHQSPLRAHRRTRVMLFVAWIVAFVISLPQLLVWRSYLAFESINWSQCLQIWEIARMESMRHGENITEGVGEGWDSQTMYSMIHVLLVFWIPAAIILTCYIVVLSWVYVNSRPSLGSSLRPIPRESLNTGMDTAETVLTKDWKPTISMTKTMDDKGNPRIIISDECARPLADKGGVRLSDSSVDTCRVVHINSQSYNARITRSRAIRVSFLLVAAYLICWLPYNVLSVFPLIDPMMFSSQLTQIYWLHGLVVFNSVVNPYLYGLFGTFFWRPRGE